MGPFSLDELQKSAPAYTKWISGVFYWDLLGRLLPGQRGQLGDVHLDVPLQLQGALDPGFVLSIVSDPVSRRVVVPIRTLRWLDEYCGLIPYLETTGSELRTKLALIYDAMLALPNKNERPPGPFAAFKLGDWIYKDNRVKDTSNKLLNSIFVFLLAHELGHLAKNHQSGLSDIKSQLQEREADEYAFDLMAQIGINPIGIAFLFLAAAMMEGGQRTHPLSGTRVIAAAEQMEKRPDSFIDHSEPNPESWVLRILGEARKIRDVLPYIDQTETRAEIMRAAQNTRFDQLPDLLQQHPRGGPPIR
jgi:hypothetical protein